MSAEKMMTVEYTLTTSPVDALFREVTLLVGVEEPEGEPMRVFLGARYKGIYVEVSDETEKEFFRRGWGAGGHCWMYPIPPREMLCQEVRAAESVSS